MKIVHIALCGPFTEGWTYQENLLSKYHKKMGFDVTIITSCWKYNNDGKLVCALPQTYIYHGIKIIRIKTLKGTIDSKFKKYDNFIHILEDENPDVLFIHGCQFIDIKQICYYLKKTQIVTFVDNHCDFSNSGRNFLSKYILHRVIWRRYAKMIEPFVKKFYGVLPARVDFLITEYHLPKEKTKLLLMGGDDELVEKSALERNKNAIRNSFSIKEDDFLIVTGGKFDKFKKQVLILMESIKRINNNSIKLIVFGSVDNDFRSEFNQLIDNKLIFYAGWVNPEMTYDYFSAADLVVFPGRHSVFWEQVASQGIPMILKFWEKTNHLDNGGNIEYLYNDSVDSLCCQISRIVEHKDIYDTMKKSAIMHSKKYLYSSIAKESLDYKNE